MERAVVVGPSPYRYASFAALRHTYGKLFVQCTPCRRYVVLSIAGIENRDYRVTTFSCSVCGAPGEMKLDDPGEQNFRLDRRDNAKRHPAAYARVTGRTYVARSPSSFLLDPPKRGP